MKRTKGTEKVETGYEKRIYISTALWDTFLKQPNGMDAFVLYGFYQYTGIWQGTDQPKATDGYCMKGLRWSDRKFRRAKTALIELDLT
jgi:hypothetical protein